MNKVWPTILGVFLGLIILSQLFFGRSDRTSYWVARKALDRPAAQAQAPSDLVLQWHLHHYYQR